MLYLDTSVLVAALTSEARTDDIQSWLSEQEADDLAISDWTITEFSSAMSLKLRTGQIEADHRASALAVFNSLKDASLATLSVSPAHFRTAARLADQHAAAVRAGDALHLAIASENGATLATLDVQLAKAGTLLGVKTLLL